MASEQYTVEYVGDLVHGDELDELIDLLQDWSIIFRAREQRLAA